MKVRITIEYDTDDDHSLEQTQQDWISGEVGFQDVWELAGEYGCVVKFEEV